MSYLIKEDRIAKVGTIRRIALYPIKFRNVPVTALTGGEYIRFTVFNENGTLLQATTNAVYELIYTTDRGVDIYAWSSMLSVGTSAQRIKIVWEIQIGAAYEDYTDYIDVEASVFNDRAYQITADAEVV